MSEELENLRKIVISCNKCDLEKTRTNAVAGKGYYKSEIMFIGEAPG